MKKSIPLLFCLLIIISCGSSVNSPIQDTPQQIATSQYTTTTNGVQVHDITVGAGNITQPGRLLTVHYTGWLESGIKFDSSLDRNDPFQFVLDGGRVIPGWEEGVSGMRIGGHRQLIIPPALAYGANGSGSTIPPNATLIFEIELINIQ
ncbi:MAG: FKBP-type peptidyl-prolyl cis-trans isomerase [Candidatus Latescibacteria bacterium]|jgi:FKBP-type peptidyl-prolyl cis-trans isomerase|nr:FKBP-type peptidyl-prolyl cis-trans isomerase [Candidatus Latescibacterota bacterium]MBT4137519.1 FKBP-type peptidyl-prolyl cis-trans isomerase [Candidatus Latescibacterota bacterium]MBT5830985.1 FKBP-type peptidyl-prolyl cis-trans isomerase [Candidatus Latescibacterota bacterium]